LAYAELDRRLSSDRRIKKRSDFLAIQSKGRKSRTKYLLLSYRKTEPCSTKLCSRIGVTVTKKIDKRSARRNRLKRRIKEVFRLNRFKFQFNADVVVVALNGATEISFAQVRKDLLYLFYQSTLLKPKV
jgi:ribonuclease P protein component